jgi:hypothetical protein
MSIPAKTFSKQALQSISLHRGRHLLPGDRKSEARAVAGALADQDGNARVAAPNITFENLPEIVRSG